MSNKKTYKVYIHTTPDGMVYVGVTGQDLIFRWRPSAYKGTAIEHYIKEYGWENIKHEVIYTCEDKDEAYQVEEEMRQYYEEKGCCINMRQSGLIKVKDMNAYNRQLYQNNTEYREKKNERSRQYYQKKKAEKELNRMVEAELKKLRTDQTISLMNEIIQFRKITINNYL